MSDFNLTACHSYSLLCVFFFFFKRAQYCFWLFLIPGSIAHNSAREILLHPVLKCRLLESTVTSEEELMKIMLQILAGQIGAITGSRAGD